MKTRPLKNSNGRRGRRLAVWAGANLLGLALTSGALAAGCGEGGKPYVPVPFPVQEIFPIKIVNAPILQSDGYDTQDPGGSAYPCSCPSATPPFVKVGTPASYWTPGDVVETVKCPYYFPLIGTSLAPSGALAGHGMGSFSTGDGGPNVFMQTHRWRFPYWQIIGAFTDSLCAGAAETAGAQVELSRMSELDPGYKDASVAALLDPMVYLVNNPSAQHAVAADASASQLGKPLTALFYSLGAQGSVYPLTGDTGSAELVQSQAELAAKSLFIEHRRQLICDENQDLCGCIKLPVWDKRNYKWVQQLPVRATRAHWVGLDGQRFASGMNPTNGTDLGGADNALRIEFHKTACCATP